MITCFLDGSLVVILILGFALLSLLLTVLATLMIFLSDKYRKASLILRTSLMFPLNT